MIGPIVGGLITEFTKSVNNTFYFSAFVFLFLAIFYGVYFIKVRKAQRD
ncbi:major facilitator superfamily permease [Staphylococcus gallinarum]|uniref:Major facilitator superfamily permease n=2 Tax=Staphylococcus gallinarum TaxID=1293 RepID=A0A380FF17_STAGA|nr:major facilitator superfamily permease [Staphylococcus gallinarum]